MYVFIISDKDKDVFYDLVSIGYSKYPKFMKSIHGYHGGVEIIDSSHVQVTITGIETKSWQVGVGQNLKPGSLTDLCMLVKNQDGSISYF